MTRQIVKGRAIISGMSGLPRGQNPTEKPTLYCLHFLMMADPPQLGLIRADAKGDQL